VCIVADTYEKFMSKFAYFLIRILKLTYVLSHVFVVVKLQKSGSSLGLTVISYVLGNSENFVGKIVLI